MRPQPGRPVRPRSGLRRFHAGREMVEVTGGESCWGAEYLNPVEQPGAIDAADGQ